MKGKIMLRKIISLFVLLAGLSLVYADHPVKSSKPLKLLFIQTARSGKLIATGSRKKYTLVLSQLNPYVTYFADRPKRITGVMPLSTFIQHWSQGTNSFAFDKPNVGLEGVLSDSTHSAQYLFKMSDPRYNIKTKTMHYTMVALPNQRPINKNQMDFSHVALFIDSWNPCHFIGGGCLS